MRICVFFGYYDYFGVVKWIGWRTVYSNIDIERLTGDGRLMARSLRPNTCATRVRTLRLLQREESSLSVCDRLGPLQEFDLTFPGEGALRVSRPRGLHTRVLALDPPGTHYLLILCYLGLRTLWFVCCFCVSCCALRDDFTLVLEWRKNITIFARHAPNINTFNSHVRRNFQKSCSNVIFEYFIIQSFAL